MTDANPAPTDLQRQIRRGLDELTLDMRDLRARLVQIKKTLAMHARAEERMELRLSRIEAQLARLQPAAGIPDAPHDPGGSAQ